MDFTMKKFTVNNNSITINSNTYNVTTIDKTTLSNGKIKDVNGVQIKNNAKIYLFVLNKDCLDFNIDFFNREVTGIFVKNGCPYTKVVNVPPFINKTRTLKIHRIFYIGSAKNVLSRIREHWTSDNITNTTSLKLGFASRSTIKDYLDIYIINANNNTNNGSNCNRRTLEKDIRNTYGSYFGK